MMSKLGLAFTRLCESVALLEKEALSLLNEKNGLEMDSCQEVVYSQLDNTGEGLDSEYTGCLYIFTSNQGVSIEFHRHAGVDTLEPETTKQLIRMLQRGRYFNYMGSYKQTDFIEGDYPDGTTLLRLVFTGKNLTIGCLEMSGHALKNFLNVIIQLGAV
jgi:hypothetical protein